MGNKQSYSRKDLERSGEEEFHLTHEQVGVLLDNFEKFKKSYINRREFHTIVKTVAYKFPNVRAFDPEVSDLTFDIFDTNQDGHIYPSQLIRGVALLSTGTVQEKAELAFDSYDHNNDGFIDKAELREHAKFAVHFAKKVIEKHSKKEKGAVFLVSLEPVLKKIEGQTIEKLVEEAFRADKDLDGKLSKTEWVEGARTNSAIKTLIDPYSQAHIFDTVPEHLDKSHIRQSKDEIKGSSSPRPSQELRRLSQVFRSRDSASKVLTEEEIFAKDSPKSKNNDVDEIPDEE